MTAGICVKRRLLLGTLVFIAMIFLGLNASIGSAESVAAPRSTSYEVSWYKIAGGGAMNLGGAYTLNGTIGQPDAGMLGDGTYFVRGGFWSNVQSMLYYYFPMIQRNAP